MIAFVVALSLLLLTVVFRAPVVALKAAVMNLLSVAAAYGVMVVVFQRGWGASFSACRTAARCPAGCRS